MKLTLVGALALTCAAGLTAQTPTQNPAQNIDAIKKEISSIRNVPDTQRGAATSKIALEIRQLPAGPDKLKLATVLTMRSTEGDFGKQALTDVATTLAETLKQTPQPDKDGKPAFQYMQLAQLERYEGIPLHSDLPQVAAAIKILATYDADTTLQGFALKDLTGKTITQADLKGKVVLVNFWATWCPPCRKEMPDLNSLQKEFAGKGLVILSITNDDPAKVRQMITGSGYTPVVLLDEGEKTWKQFHIDGIPQSFVFSRDGKLSSRAIDMRTRGQFLAMLAKAGIH